MAAGDMTLFSMLRSRMHWHEERQKLLAENVSNANTPGYRSRDLHLPDFSSMMRSNGAGPARTDSHHMTLGSTLDGSFRLDRKAGGLITSPSKNAVDLESEMMKVSQNQLDYQAVSNLYQNSLSLIRTAIGRKG